MRAGGKNGGRTVSKVPCKKIDARHQGKYTADECLIICEKAE